MIDVTHEAAQPSTGPGFGDAVTFAFGDPGAALFGSARLGLGGEAAATASALALLFADGEVAAADHAADARANGAGLERLAVGDVVAEIVRPLEEWRVVFEREQGGFDLRFTAVGAPGELGPEGAVAALAGLRGYEQPCRVEGSARVGTRSFEVACLGQRGHQWGAPNWKRLALARTLSAWFEDGEAVILTAVRPTRAKGHGEEAISALLFMTGEPAVIADPRLSTVYDGEGRQRRASLELWVGEEDDIPRRIAGEAVCGTSIELGSLRLDASFFRWRARGREGVGRYDVLRRA